MQLPKQVTEAIRILDGAGYEANVVGGAVRDHLLGRPVTDYDLAVSALPGEVSALFEEKGYRVIPTGERHGTVTVISATSRKSQWCQCDKQELKEMIFHSR